MREPHRRARLNPNPDERAAAVEQLQILQRADAFTHMLESPGWKSIFALHEEWAETYAKAAKTAETKDGPAALDALRMWQLAEEFLRLEVGYINQTLKDATEIRGARTLDEALLMEHLQHEQSQSPSPAGTDRGGY